MTIHTAELLSPNSVPILPKPEYVIYSFEKDTLSKGSPTWSKAMSLSDQTEAFRQAQNLFQTSKFTRVEVRSKSVNDLTGAVEYKPIKILDVSPARLQRLSWLFLSALACAFVAGLIVLVGN